jgi:hypothetical protein
LNKIVRILKFILDYSSLWSLIKVS